MGGDTQVQRQGTNTLTSSKVKLSVYIQRGPGDAPTGIAGLPYKFTKGNDL